MSFRDRLPPIVDVTPGEPGERDPFARGGHGHTFYLLSNRNQVSTLVDEATRGPVDFITLTKIFPMGYATLFVLEKRLAYALDGKGHIVVDAPRRRLDEHDGARFAIVPHPSVVGVGGHFFDDAPSDATARLRAKALAKETRGPVVVARVIRSESWH